MDYNRDPRQQLHPTTVADESLPYPSAPCSAVPNNVLSLGGGTVANYLLTATSQQQPSLAIPVSGRSVQGFRKVLVKPIAPKQNIPSMAALPPGPVSFPTNSGTMVDLSQPMGFPSIPPPPSSFSPSLPSNSNLHIQQGTTSSGQPLSPPPPPPFLPPSGLATEGENTGSTNQSSNKQIKRRSSSQSSSTSNVSVSANKPRKPCNCKNSQCLKLYCDCFANGEFCRDSCNCQNCKNSFQYEEDRSRAVKACLERNPNAFKPKVGHGRIGDERRHIKGCNCKKSNCLKNYCECYEAKIPCSHLCRCVGCQNLADRPEGKGLMQLANAADLRTQQQKAASSHFLEDMLAPQFMHPSHREEGQRLPYSFVNKDVTRATVLCLLEEASHASSSGKSPVDVERAVLIEFGRCLEQIISSSESANQSSHKEPVSGRV